jgi:hypothetical protein
MADSFLNFFRGFTMGSNKNHIQQKKRSRETLSQKPIEPESLACEGQASKRQKIENDRLKQEPTTTIAILSRQAASKAESTNIASLSRQATSEASKQLMKENLRLKEENVQLKKGIHDMEEKYLEAKGDLSYHTGLLQEEKKRCMALKIKSKQWKARNPRQQTPRVGFEKQFKYDKIKVFPPLDSRLEMKEVTCYFCNQNLYIPLTAVYPFHRKLNDIGGKTKDSKIGGKTKDSKERKRQEHETKKILADHNMRYHSVTIGEVPHCIELFETFKKEEYGNHQHQDIQTYLKSRALANSFFKVDLAAEHLSDNPFTDCRAYFERWKKLIQKPDQAANLARAASRSSKNLELNDVDMKAMNLKVNQYLIWAVTGVVDGVHKLLEEVQEKNGAEFSGDEFQNQICTCIHTHAGNLGGENRAFKIACMIQRRMLALPELFKQVVIDA